MLFNFCRSYQFKTRLTINNSLIEQVTQTRLLGVILSDDLTWHTNTNHLVKKAYTRMIILRRLSEFKVEKADMIKIYVLFIRVAIEQSSVVWSSALTKQEEKSLERVQKVALKIIYQSEYISYDNALQMSKLPSIAERYKTLLYKFAVKCVRNEKTQDMFPLRQGLGKIRKSEIYDVPMARKQRLFASAIPTMARMMNAK